jgi:hypothetical protein
VRRGRDAFRELPAVILPWPSSTARIPSVRFTGRAAWGQRVHRRWAEALYPPYLMRGVNDAGHDAAAESALRAPLEAVARRTTSSLS